MHVYFLCIDDKKSYCCEYLQMMNEVLKICDKYFAISRLPPDTIDQKIAKIKIINCSKHSDQPNDRSKSMYPKWKKEWQKMSHNPLALSLFLFLFVLICRSPYTHVHWTRSLSKGNGSLWAYVELKQFVHFLNAPVWVCACFMYVCVFWEVLNESNGKC